MPYAGNGGCGIFPAPWGPTASTGSLARSRRVELQAVIHAERRDESFLMYCGATRPWPTAGLSHKHVIEMTLQLRAAVGLDGDRRTGVGRAKGDGAWV